MSTSRGNIWVQPLLSALKLDFASRRKASFSISSKSPLPGWQLYTFDTESLPVYLLEAIDYGLTQAYSFSLTVNKEAFILICNLGNKIALVAKRPGKDGNPFVRRALINQDDVQKVVAVLRKIDLSNSLMAHSSLSSAINLLHEGVERDFVNLGLFSNYFLTQRLSKHLTDRGRSVSAETDSFFEKMDGEMSTGVDGAKKILEALGFELRSSNRSAATTQEYNLFPTRAAAKRSVRNN